MNVPAFSLAAALAATNPAGEPPAVPEAAGTPDPIAEAEPASPAHTQAAAPGGADDAPPAPADATSPGRAEILVEGETGPPPGDPLEDLNVQTFEVVQAVDKALVEPVTHGYIKAVPKPLRDGIHNVVTNLDEPIVFLSFLLQLQPIQAIKTLGRFVVNSTLGIAGLFDVAKDKPFNRPHVQNGFGHTLGYYGVKPGPFLYLPLMGSTTVRDLLGRIAEIPVLPLAVGRPFNHPAYVIPNATISAIDERAQDDPRLQTIRRESSNPYAAFRSYYLRKRQAEIDLLKGLRTSDEVPVFEDELLPDVEGPPRTDAGAGLDSSAPPAGDPQLPVDREAMLAE